MSMTDPIADMLTRIRNANLRRHPRVNIPHSRVKEGIMNVLKDEGYVDDFKVNADEQKPFIKTMTVYLRYDEAGEPVLNELKRVSKPGCRVFKSVEDLKTQKVLDGLGVAVLSTSRGFKSDRTCKKERIGGEILCTVW
jgi:small subunit ribosomal protein S8